MPPTNDANSKSISLYLNTSAQVLAAYPSLIELFSLAMPPLWLPDIHAQEMVMPPLKFTQYHNPFDEFASLIVQGIKSPLNQITSDTRLSLDEYHLNCLFQLAVSENENADQDAQFILNAYKAYPAMIKGKILKARKNKVDFLLIALESHLRALTTDSEDGYLEHFNALLQIANKLLEMLDVEGDFRNQTYNEIIENIFELRTQIELIAQHPGLKTTAQKIAALLQYKKQKEAPFLVDIFQYHHADRIRSTIFDQRPELFCDSNQLYIIQHYDEISDAQQFIYEIYKTITPCHQVINRQQSQNVIKKVYQKITSAEAMIAERDIQLFNQFLIACKQYYCGRLMPIEFLKITKDCRDSFASTLLKEKMTVVVSLIEKQKNFVFVTHLNFSASEGNDYVQNEITRQSMPFLTAYNNCCLSLREIESWVVKHPRLDRIGLVEFSSQSDRIAKIMEEIKGLQAKARHCLQQCEFYNVSFKNETIDFNNSILLLKETATKMASAFHQGLNKINAQLPRIQGLGTLCCKTTMRMMTATNNTDMVELKKVRDQQFVHMRLVERDPLINEQFTVIKALIEALTDYERDRATSMNLFKRFNMKRSESAKTALEFACSFLNGYYPTKQTMPSLIRVLTDIKREIEAEYAPWYVVGKPANSQLYRVVSQAIVSLHHKNVNLVQDILSGNEATEVLSALTPTSTEEITILFGEANRELINNNIKDYQSSPLNLRKQPRELHANELRRVICADDFVEGVIKVSDMDNRKVLIQRSKTIKAFHAALESCCSNNIKEEPIDYDCFDSADFHGLNQRLQIWINGEKAESQAANPYLKLLKSQCLFDYANRVASQKKGQEAACNAFQVIRQQLIEKALKSAMDIDPFKLQQLQDVLNEFSVLPSCGDYFAGDKCQQLIRPFLQEKLKYYYAYITNKDMTKSEKQEIVADLLLTKGCLTVGLNKQVAFDINQSNHITDVYQIFLKHIKLHNTEHTENVALLKEYMKQVAEPLSTEPGLLLTSLQSVIIERYAEWVLLWGNKADSDHLSTYSYASNLILKGCDAALNQFFNIELHLKKSPEESVYAAKRIVMAYAEIVRQSEMIPVFENEKNCLSIYLDYVIRAKDIEEMQRLASEGLFSFDHQENTKGQVLLLMLREKILPSKEQSSLPLESVIDLFQQQQNEQQVLALLQANKGIFTSEISTRLSALVAFHQQFPEALPCKSLKAFCVTSWKNLNDDIEKSEQKGEDATTLYEAQNNAHHILSQLSCYTMEIKQFMSLLTVASSNHDLANLPSLGDYDFKNLFESIKQHANQFDAVTIKTMAEQFVLFFNSLFSRLTAQSDLISLKPVMHSLPGMVDVYQSIKSYLPITEITTIDQHLANICDQFKTTILPELHPLSDYFIGDKSESARNNLDKEARETLRLSLLTHCLVYQVCHPEDQEMNARLWFLRSAYLTRHGTVKESPNHMQQSPFRYNTVEYFFWFADRFPAFSDFHEVWFSRTSRDIKPFLQSNNKQNRQDYSAATRQLFSKEPLDKKLLIQCYLVYHAFLKKIPNSHVKLREDLVQAINGLINCYIIQGDVSLFEKACQQLNEMASSLEAAKLVVDNQLSSAFNQLKQVQVMRDVVLNTMKVAPDPLLTKQTYVLNLLAYATQVKEGLNQHDCLLLVLDELKNFIESEITPDFREKISEYFGIPGESLESIIEHMEQRLKKHNASTKCYNNLCTILEKLAHNQLPITDTMAEWPDKLVLDDAERFYLAALLKEAEIQLPWAHALFETIRQVLRLSSSLIGNAVDSSPAQADFKLIHQQLQLLPLVKYLADQSTNIYSSLIFDVRKYFGNEYVGWMDSEKEGINKKAYIVEHMSAFNQFIDCAHDEPIDISALKKSSSYQLWLSNMPPFSSKNVCAKYPIGALLIAYCESHLHESDPLLQVTDMLFFKYLLKNQLNYMDAQHIQYRNFKHVITTAIKDIDAWLAPLLENNKNIFDGMPMVEIFNKRHLFDARIAEYHIQISLTGMETNQKNIKPLVDVLTAMSSLPTGKYTAKERYIFCSELEIMLSKLAPLVQGDSQTMGWLQQHLDKQSLSMLNMIVGAEAHSFLLPQAGLELKQSC